MPIDERKLQLAEFNMLPYKYRGARLAGKIDTVREMYKSGYISAHKAMEQIDETMEAYNESMNDESRGEANEAS